MSDQNTATPTQTPPPSDGSSLVTEEITAPSMKGARWRSFLLTLAAPVAAFLIALVVVILVVLASGRGIGEVFDSIGNTMDLARNWIDMINKAGMYFISALAVAVGFRMNLFNIGVEGQYRLAALFAAYVGASVGDLPPVLHILVMIVTAMIVGAIWAGIAGFLKVTRGVSEVISTIMLNAIAAALIGFLLRDAGFSPDSAGRRPATPPLPESAWFPNINGMVDPILNALGLKPPPLSANTYGFLLVAILLGVIYAFMLKRTRFGFDLRASGQNPEAARASGVNAKRMTIYAMLISGALAGLAGLPELLGGRQHSFDETFVTGVGWAGISVALLGRNNPVGMFIAAFIWSFLDVATRGFQLIGISNKLSAIMQAVVLFAVVIAYTVVSRRTKAAEAKSVAANAPPKAGTEPATSAGGTEPAASAASTSSSGPGATALSPGERDTSRSSSEPGATSPSSSEPGATPPSTGEPGSAPRPPVERHTGDAETRHDEHDPPGPRREPGDPTNDGEVK